MKKITCVIVTIFSAFISNATLATTQSADANWMSKIPGDRVMNQLIIPGTHDSGTYAIIPLSKFSLSPDDALPIWIEALNNILPISIVRMIVAGWSKTQTYDITQQLDQGVRYLDFRTCAFTPLFQHQHFYFCHTLLGSRLKNALKQIQQFVADHPSEIIILDINHVFGIKNNADETQLVILLQNYLGNIVIPNSYSPTSTMKQLRKSKRNVIILMNTSYPVAGSSLQDFAAKYLWSESNINSPWPKVSTVTNLENKLNTFVAFRAKTVFSSSKFFVLQSIQTENAQVIINGILDKKKYPNNIKRYEAPVNNLLNTWLTSYIATYGQPAINIVIQDWYTKDSPQIALAIQYDTQSLPTLGHSAKDALINQELMKVKHMYLSTRTLPHALL